MEDALGTQIATSLGRVPSNNRLGLSGGQPSAEPVSWDEMGQRGLHKALEEVGAW